MVAVVVAIFTVIVVIVRPAMAVIIVRRVPGDRPVLELDDSAADKITESRELRHIRHCNSRWLRDGQDFLVRDELWVDAPCSNEEFVIIVFGYNLWQSNLNTGTGGS